MGLKTIKVHKGQRIKLTPSPEMLANNKAFKEWEVITHNITIDEDNTFTVGMQDVMIRANYYDVTNVQGTSTFPETILTGEVESLPSFNVQGSFKYDNPEPLNGGVDVVYTTNSSLELSSNIAGQVEHYRQVESNITIDKSSIKGLVGNYDKIICNGVTIPNQITSNSQVDFAIRVFVEGDVTFDNILTETQITHLLPNTNQGVGVNDPNHPNYGTPEYCNLNLFHPSNKCEFKDYCLRRLGKPVIQINVSDSQIEDLIAEGVDYFQLYHYDGSETLYYPITITKEIIQSQSIPIDGSKFIGVNRLLESSFYGQSQFTVEWQLMASTYPYALKGDGLLTYYQAMQYQSLLRLMVSGKTKDIRFSRHTNRLYLNCDWTSLKEGQVFVAEVVQRIDPNDNPSIWNDPFLKEYITALIKLQWGNNLRKLKGVQMIGGVQIDADGILNEAIQELQNLKENMIWKHQEPLDFWMG